MTRGAIVLGVLLATAQSVTGPTADPRGSSGTAGTGRWSADATVGRLVYDPIKIIGMRAFAPRSRVGLKAVMDRAESGVRDVMADLSAGKIDESGARIELAHVLRDYRVDVRRLRAAR